MKRSFPTLTTLPTMTNLAPERWIFAKFGEFDTYCDTGHDVKEAKLWCLELWPTFWDLFQYLLDKQSEIKMPEAYWKDVSLS